MSNVRGATRSVHGVKWSQFKSNFTAKINQIQLVRIYSPTHPHRDYESTNDFNHKLTTQSRRTTRLTIATSPVAIVNTHNPTLIISTARSWGGHFVFINTNKSFANTNSNSYASYYIPTTTYIKDEDIGGGTR